MRAPFPEPQPGDLIEIFRPFYRHWAVYIGNGYVIHLAPPSEIPGAGVASVMSALTDKALVKKERLCDVVGRDRYHVNNKHDGRYSPLPPSKIVQRAEELVGQEVLYKLTSENCEHFVNELRYGVPRSDQVTDVLMTQGVTAGVIGEVGPAPAALPSCRSKREKQLSCGGRICICLLESWNDLPVMRLEPSGRSRWTCKDAAGLTGRLRRNVRL